jgi:hypothetical protein
MQMRPRSGDSHELLSGRHGQLELEYGVLLYLKTQDTENLQPETAGRYS